MRTVVVTAIGSFSADIVIKKCRENGIRIIGCDVYPCLLYTSDAADD